MFEPKNNWRFCGDVGIDSLGFMLAVEIELIFICVGASILAYCSFNTTRAFYIALARGVQ